MPTKVNVPSPGKEEKSQCGFCGRRMTHADIDAGHMKSCTVCGKKQQIKPKCVFRLVANVTGSPANLFQNIDKETFKKTDVQLMCSDCKEKCFFCNVYHGSKSELVIFNSLSFVSHSLM